MDETNAHGTARVVALVMMLLSSAPAPMTVSSLPRKSELSEEAHLGAATSSRFASSGLLHTGTSIAGTASINSNELPEAVIADRPTTAIEEVIGQIRSWTLLGSDWDGEGAAAPILSSLKEADVFVNILSPDIPAPAPMLLASGRAGLYWNDGNLYADLEFTGENHVTYYIEHRGKGKHKGVVAFDSNEMPAVFSTLLLA